MTDVHMTDTGSVGNIVLTSPIVIGHEVSGVVIKVGPDVTNVQPGRLDWFFVCFVLFLLKIDIMAAGYLKFCPPALVIAWR